MSNLEITNDDYNTEFCKKVQAHKDILEIFMSENENMYESGLAAAIRLYDKFLKGKCEIDSSVPQCSNFLFDTSQFVYEQLNKDHQLFCDWVDTEYNNWFKDDAFLNNKNAKSCMKSIHKFIIKTASL